MSGEDLADAMRSRSIVDGDYSNEIFGLTSRMMTAYQQAVHAGTITRPENAQNVLARELFTNLNDAELLTIVKAAQGMDTVKTPEERFFDANSDQNIVGTHFEQVYTQEAQANPVKIRRLNELAGILNTSNNAQEFRQAFNETLALMNKDPFFST